MLTAKESLLLLARDYAAAEGVELVTVSWRVFRDSKKLRALADPRYDIQTRRYEKALEWFSANWPSAVPWPDGVIRPPVVDEAAA
jgi:hypothetical protein